MLDSQTSIQRLTSAMTLESSDCVEKQRHDGDYEPGSILPPAALHPTLNSSLSRSPVAKPHITARNAADAPSPRNSSLFKSLTGITPHQYVMRDRLREAASRLATGTQKVLDVALDCGFCDISNFNRAFRAEFGVSPRAFRRASRLTLTIP